MAHVIEALPEEHHMPMIEESEKTESPVSVEKSGGNSESVTKWSVESKCNF